MDAFAAVYFAGCLVVLGVWVSNPQRAVKKAGTVGIIVGMLFSWLSVGILLGFMAQED